MVETPASVHDMTACRSAFLDRLSTLGREDVEAVKELIQCLEDADLEERKEIARSLMEIIYPEVVLSGLEVDRPIASDARAKVDRYRKEVGKRIRQRRRQLGMTQEQLAEAAGIPQSHVSRLELGKHAPTHLTIQRIADAMDIEPGLLDPGCDD
jgi:DNA-binding XRE family transcriptional regulator